MSCKKLQKQPRSASWQTPNGDEDGDGGGHRVENVRCGKLEIARRLYRMKRLREQQQQLERDLRWHSPLAMAHAKWGGTKIQKRTHRFVTENFSRDIQRF